VTGSGPDGLSLVPGKSKRYFYSPHFFQTFPICHSTLRSLQARKPWLQDIFRINASTEETFWMPEGNMGISATSTGFRSRQLNKCCRVHDITTSCIKE
jgi:hypothetical protein